MKRRRDQRLSRRSSRKWPGIYPYTPVQALEVSSAPQILNKTSETLDEILQRFRLAGYDGLQKAAQVYRIE